MLKGKKILLIAPSFFGYEYDIVKKIEELGGDVDYFDERPFESSFAKIMNRLDVKFFIRRRIDAYYENVANCSREKGYDYLLVISPETLECKTVKKIKEYNPNIKTILYMWDSFKNKNAADLIPVFDRVFSFDKSDGIEDERICFLPLFYNDFFSSQLRQDVADAKYTATFIGTIHSDRAKLAKKILNDIEMKGYKTYSFFYCPSKLLFVLKKLFTDEFDFLKFKEVSFVSMSKEELKSKVLDSSIIIDIQHPKQSGLTMRTIEMFGVGRKLVTTNADVADYNLFNKDNILVVDRVAPTIPQYFIDLPYVKPKKEIHYQYSLASWLSAVLGVEYEAES
ncbi:lipopolysaccharide biosynthesis protein [Vibrio splendidus]|uniref:lipopolysaccharide biosynthesis protein n=1 Tax=Vibrio splendidus TaxID=29497 RepID=UPI000D397D22|nr:lipopolysaccharide biosynthesis protein [Vibrio splendidus]PTQ08894.1 lipopolysaccharide biosynthesis protein [Vibrio splendidus]